MALNTRSFGFQVLVGMVAGLLLGLLARQIGAGPDGELNWLATTLKTVGAVFVSLLKAIVPPLVFAAIVASIANLRARDNAARLEGQTLLWFAITALIAVAIGISIGVIVQPGVGVSTAALAARQPDSVGGWLDFLKGLVPGNSLALSAGSKTSDSGAITTTISFNILQLLVISIAVGLATLKVGEKAEPFLAFVRSLLAVVRAILGWIIRLTPIGSAALIGDAVVRYGWTTLTSLGTYALAVYLGLALVLLVVYPAVLASHGLSPAWFYRCAWPAIQLGFVSRSSVGTLPVTEELTERALGVPRAYAAFAVPLGATTKMDGCAAVYPAISAIFVAQFFGIALHPSDYAVIAAVSVLGSAATAGLTGATVMLTLTLSTLGLPLEGVGLLLAIDPILDMGRTATNVAGQMLVPVIVAHRERLVTSVTT